MPDTQTFDYDVFISHSSKDKPIVRELANRLKADGFKVWLDEWEIKPGDSIGLKIQRGLEKSRILLLCMSANAFGSDWATLEWHTVLFRDPTNRKRRFIPLRLDDSTIPDMIGQFAYVDWRHNTAEQYTRLRASLSAHSLKNDPQESHPTITPVRVLEGHTSWIDPVAITPDGKRIVSGSEDRTIRIWDIDSGKCLTTLKGHTSVVRAIAVTSNGKRIVSGSFDKTIRIWDIDSDKCLTMLEGHTGPVYGIAVTPDGKRIVSGSGDKTIRIWDIDSGKCLATLNGHSSFVHGIAVTPNGKRIVSGSGDRTIRIWDSDTGKRLTTLKGHTGAVYGIAITPNSEQIVSGSADKTIRIWDIDSGKCLATLEGHTGLIYGIAITPNSVLIVSGSFDRTIRIWDIVSGNCLTTLEGYADQVHGIAVTPNNKRIVSGSMENTIRVWDISGIDTAASGPAPKRFTNAKVLLVGDSGVGKSGLAMRLVHDRFEQTISTEGVASDRISLSDDEWATRLQLSFNYK
jgi:WD40 repeat protein